jgi:HD superfamily phosphodiesterase
MHLVPSHTRRVTIYYQARLNVTLEEKRVKFDHYLLEHADLKTLHELVKRDFCARGLVHHNWNHLVRDLARALMIGEREGANMKIVLAGVLLHGIGRLHPQEGEDHHLAGAKAAPKYLADAGFSQSEIDSIVHCVKAHGFRGAEAPKTLEAKVCYDADVLSCSVGYVGVARGFDFFRREEKIGVKDMIEIPSSRKGLRQDFYTTTERTVGQKGLEKARDFWDALRHELREEERTVKEAFPEYKGD